MQWPNEKGQTIQWPINVISRSRKFKNIYVKIYELFNGKGLKAEHMICVGLFHSNAGKNVIYNFS
jgi:hypothetical protein